MNTIRSYVEEGITIYELKNSAANSWITVAPERGGIVIELGFNGEELLYCNKETLYNKKSNIRGGIPILFPISGQLENGQYEWHGKTYSMKNHGVARNRPWEVIATNEDELSITLKMQSNESTKAEFPFDFELLFTYVLKENELTILQHYKNLSAEDMPIYAGFHPYFKSDSTIIKLASDATKILDYNDMEEKSFNGTLDMANKKESIALLDSSKKEISFELGKKITMTYGNHFKYVVVWTESGQPFICVEPWMAKNGELHEKKELVMVQPGTSVTTFLSIRV